MASKTSKKSTASTATATPVQTPAASSSASSGRSRSPLSPTRYNRLQEKAELQNLNDRLAVYIDRVRQLETENSRLSREIQSYQEVSTREVVSIKAMYEQELVDARNMLNETSKEKAKMEIDMKRMWEENEDLQNR
jgi:lamin B